MDWSGFRKCNHEAFDEGEVVPHQLLGCEQNSIVLTVYHEPLFDTKSEYNRDKRILLTVPMTEDEVRLRRDKLLAKVDKKDLQAELCNVPAGNAAHQQKRQQLFGGISQVVRPHGKRGFEVDVPAKALSYVMATDRHGNFSEFSVEPVQGVMSRATTYQEAEARRKDRKNPDYTIKQAVRFHHMNFPDRYRHGVRNHKLSTIQNDIGVLACRNLTDIALQRGIDVVAHVSTAQGPRLVELSELNDMVQVQQHLKDRAVIQASASRDPVHGYNIKRLADALTKPVQDKDFEGYAAYIANFKNEKFSAARPAR